MHPFELETQWIFVLRNVSRWILEWWGVREKCQVLWLMLVPHRSPNFPLRWRCLHPPTQHHRRSRRPLRICWVHASPHTMDRGMLTRIEHIGQNTHGDVLYFPNQVSRFHDGTPKKTPQANKRREWDFIDERIWFSRRSWCFQVLGCPWVPTTLQKQFPTKCKTCSIAYTHVACWY
mgnify:CR=1 FL=1